MELVFKVTFRLLAASVCLLLCAAGLLKAQNAATAAIAGTVLDQSGKAVQAPV
jgi:hypothetical protein